MELKCDNPKITIIHKKPNILIYEKVTKVRYNEQCKLNSVEIGIRLTHKIRKCDTS